MFCIGDPIRGRVAHGQASQGADNRAAARRLWDAAQLNHLEEQAAEEAAALLSHEDPFVRGLAEWVWL